MEKKKKDGSLQVEFSRYSSLAGSRLTFTVTPQGLSWLDHAKFTLKKSPEGLSLLGLCPNYLLLQNGQKSKILVPLVPVESSRAFEPHCDLQIQDENSDRKFLEFDIKNGKAKALNPEGALFLVYLAIVQKDYTEAFKVLQEDLNLKEHFEDNINIID